MVSQPTIPKKKTSETALDYQELYAIGLKYVQNLSSRIWTDYNVHDPGITILELLCYALTDLSYRASFPIEDILASESANSENMKKQFFTARQILPNRPLTLSDYRKILIDLKGVKNAWLESASLSYYGDTVKGKLLKEKSNLPGIVEVKIGGLYNTIIEYMDDIKTESEKAHIIQQLKQKLQSNRNLCEDFVDVKEVETQSFLLCAELELTPDADVAKVKAEIIFQIQQYLAPPVNNYSLSEMLTRSKADGTFYTADEIFDSPVLDCGFIDNDELAQANLRTEIRLSDLISIIMDIAGVRAVRDIVINPQGTQTSLKNKWVVPIAPNKKAILSHDLKNEIDEQPSRLVFYKRNMPVVADNNKAKEYYLQFTQEAKIKAETTAIYDFDIPLGNYRKLDRYYSFQNHFPAVYGLSEVGLNSGADDKRKALAYQLKAYLLFFDQVMANYFAQLSHLTDLFSTDRNLHRTYFYQVVDSFADYSNIYSKTDVIDTLQTEKDTEEKSTSLERRNRFLDHLIARFAERFNDFVYIMYSAFGASPESIVKNKCEFLNSYPEISRDRAIAYNYTLQDESDLWNTENVSGLEKRLAKLLGIRNYKRRNLGDIAYDIYAELDETPGDEFRFRISKKDTFEIILSSSTHYDTPELARQAMERAIHFALLPSGYDRKISANNKYYFNIIDDKGKVVARRIEYFDTEAQINNAIDEVMEYLRVNYSDEGMYLIENILLKPEENDDPFLPICPNPNCTDCAELDPYSYRLHIILPAYSSRFNNMEFRRFTEEVIREETPAHILPKICWINKEDMAEFEKLYRDWIYLKAGVEKTQRQEKLTAFINKLFAVKNIYPAQNLHECDNQEDKPKFIIGRSSIGSKDQNKT